MTDLARRAMLVTLHELGFAQSDSLYVEGESEVRRKTELSAALVARDFKEVAMGGTEEGNSGRVRTEGGLLYASSQPFAGLLGWIGRVSLFFPKSGMENLFLEAWS